MLIYKIRKHLYRFRQKSIYKLFKDPRYPEPKITLTQMNPIPLYTHESSEEGISSCQT